MRATLTLISIVAFACSSDEGNSPPPPGNGSGQVQLQVVASGLNNPLHLTAPAGDARLFVVEKIGRIRVVQNGQLLSTPFLDITGKVSNGSEQGLLSLAFHPQYASNGLFYVNYTDRAGDTQVERYNVSSDPNRADAASAKLILAVAQPYSNHNGGQILFGPDGMLYIAMGDGGSGGDPQNHAQNRADILGDLLRVDVSGDPYSIPSDNPFRNQSGMRGEIWAYGLRNPWRVAFDRVDGNLYIADVGQNRIEEVNVVRSNAAGVNYGWRMLEGTECYSPSTGCSRSGLTLPILEYTHGEGNSITGGLVYRGTQLPSLRGHYFYADLSGWIRSFRFSNGQATDRKNWDLGSIGNILSFGEDATGELYVMSTSGNVYKFVER